MTNKTKFQPLRIQRKDPHSNLKLALMIGVAIEWSYLIVVCAFGGIF